MACSLSSLYKIDPTTAALTFVASIQGPSYGQWTGLTFLADGRLLVGGDGIYELDRRSGMTRAIVGQGSISVSGDMAGMPDGKVYASVKSKSPGGSDVLVAVDPNAFNSVAQPLFELPSDGSILGLGYVNGIALGFTESGKVMMVNILTEKTSVLSTGVQFWGAATAPAL